MLGNTSSVPVYLAGMQKQQRSNVPDSSSSLAAARNFRGRKTTSVLQEMVRAKHRKPSEPTVTSSPYIKKRHLKKHDITLQEKDLTQLPPPSVHSCWRHKATAQPALVSGTSFFPARAHSSAHPTHMGVLTERMVTAHTSVHAVGIHPPHREIRYPHKPDTPGSCSP